MAKTTSHMHAQGAFSFFEEIEKVESPAPKPQKNELKPPTQIFAEDRDEITSVEEPVQTASASRDNSPNFDDLIIPEPQVPELDANEQTENTQEHHAIDFEPDAMLPSTKAESDEISSVDTPSYTEEQDSTADQDEVSGNIFRKSARGRKSIKEHAAAAVLIEMPADEVLYSKLYYSMGEVTTMFRENHSLIRYWESEFDILKPKKNGKGDRFFKPADVKNLYLIYDLLRRRKFTIEGAKEYLKNNKMAEAKFAAIQSLEKIRGFFLELKAAL